MQEQSSLSNGKNCNVEDDTCYHTICAPIKTYREVFSVTNDLPTWYKQTISIQIRSATVIENSTFNCHLLDANPHLLPTRIKRGQAPRTILCHDMKNGYLEDKYIHDTDTGNAYTFLQWQNIDMFIYFSHHFITVPPLGWIQCAHQNGVQILGTIITECEAGEKLCEEFLCNADEVHKFVDALLKITINCKLDGWLINIENVIKSNQIQLLLTFILELTTAVHAQVENGTVLWYDSVINSGELKWQNELNDLNRCFFDVCDGIFLNYSWKDANLEISTKNALHRQNDIFVGIDVFGRNTPYAAGPDCYKGIKKAREFSLSVAIFAPGWTHECLDPNPPESFFDRFLSNDKLFWSTLWPYLYTYPVANLFETTFHPGATKESYSLCQQGLQLHHEGNCLQLQLVNGRFCYQVKKPFGISKLSWYHLLATEVDLLGSYFFIAQAESIADDECTRIDFVLQLLKDSEVSTIICRAVKSMDATEQENIIYPRVCDNIRNTTVWYYELVLNEKARLMHIYALPPLKNDVFLTKLALKTSCVTN